MTTHIPSDRRRTRAIRPDLRSKSLSLRYLDEFVRLRCAPDLLAAGMYPNAKEVTESMAAFTALRWWPGAERFGERWAALVVGDGITPRTGALLACMTRWEVYSIDPAARERARNGRIQRLHVLRTKLETAGDLPRGEDGTALVAVHSHAKSRALRAAWESLSGRPRVCVVIPCCFEQDVGEEPAVEYEDFGIQSPCRTVRVWVSP